MKKTLLLTSISLSVFLVISSCQKNVDNLPPETVDSIKNILPKQIIWHEDGNGYQIISIKYDTLNHKIELYEDDTTNTNPYDKLVISYSFNNDGFLINCMINSRSLNTGFDNEIININRGSDNKIVYIAYNDNEFDERDTSFYSYQSVSGGVNVTSTGSVGYFEDNCIYSYDNNYKLLGYQGDNEFATFSYNSNNSVDKMLGKGIGDNETDFSYSSGIPDEKEDLFYETLLGKDYYLWDLKNLYPFQFDLDPDYDNYMISGTNPYHLTHMKDIHQPDAAPTGIEEASMSYELNDQKLVSKVTFITEAVGQFPAYTDVMKLKY